jgi:hypothetical protein
MSICERATPRQRENRNPAYYCDRSVGTEGVRCSPFKGNISSWAGFRALRRAALVFLGRFCASAYSATEATESYCGGMAMILTNSTT